jgi:hypothetical protein
VEREYDGLFHFQPLTEKSIITEKNIIGECSHCFTDRVRRELYDLTEVPTDIVNLIMKYVIVKDWQTKG